MPKDDSVQPAAAARRNDADVLADLRFAYCPGWDLGRNVISSYRCVARVPTSDVGSAMCDAELVTASDAGALARLDDAVQGHVLDDLDQLIKSDRRVLLSLPVHFEAFGITAWRRRYLAELGRRLTADARKLLLIELTGVPHGVLRSRLTDLVGPLKPLCRAVTLRLPIGITDASQITGCGAAAINCDLDAQPAAEIVQMQQLNHFKRIAERAEMPAFAYGAHTLSLVAAAVGAGFQYVSGDAVAALVDDPGQIANFSLATLYRPKTG
jgi:hypothetical protein